MNRQGARLTECWGQIPPARDCWSRKSIKQPKVVWSISASARTEAVFSPGRPIRCPMGAPPRRPHRGFCWGFLGLSRGPARSPVLACCRAAPAPEDEFSLSAGGSLSTSREIALHRSARATATPSGTGSVAGGEAPGRATYGRGLLRIAVFQLPRRGWGPRLTAVFRLAKRSLQSKPQSSNAQRHRENKRRRWSV